VLAVYEAAGRAIERARAGGGPTLLECKTYRLCGHSRSDPRTYRSKEEEAEWATRDPIPRLAAHLKAAGLATNESLAEIEQEVSAAIDDAVAFAESSPSPAPEEALEDVFYGEGPAPFAATSHGGVR
jgi:TPP-dependent pyruvate/acetoin dehydrogenase alpha subunit